MTMPPEPPPHGRFPAAYPARRQYGWFPPAYPARPPAPPLTAGQRRGSLIAGAVSLPLVNLGGSLLLAAILLGVVLAFFSAILTAATRGNGGVPVDPEAATLVELLETVNATAWLLGGGLLGLLLLALGLFASFRILRAHAVPRPWAITWSATGISIPVLVAISSVLSVLGQVVGLLSLGSYFPAPGSSVPDPAVVGFGTGVLVAIVIVLVSTVVVALAGALIWWWMAHVFRRPRPEAPPARAPGPAAV